MTIQSLIDRAKATTKKWWKWILGGLIALLVGYVAWKLRKQANELAALEAERSAMKEFIKDVEARAKASLDKAQADQLRAEADKLKEIVAKRESELADLQKAYAQQKKLIDAAKTWDDLDSAAKGGQP